jgi:hypothetical protein
LPCGAFACGAFAVALLAPALVKPTAAHAAEATEESAAPPAGAPVESTGARASPKIADGTSPDPTDTDRAEADDERPGKLGVRYELDAIELRGNTRTRSRVILRYVPFRPGDQIDLDDPRLELLRYRLLGTGFFRDVQLSLTKGSRRGAVVLAIEVVERNTVVVNDFWLGLSADATPGGNSRPLTAYGGADVAETNLLGTGISIGGALAVADRQAAYRLRFTDPSFLGSKWIVSTSLLHNDARDFFGTRDVLYDPPPGEPERTDYAVLRYRRTGGEIGVGYDVSPSARVRANYHLETIDATLPRAASFRRGLDIEPIDFHLLPGRSLLSFVTLGLEDDTRDDPVLPTRGHQIQVASDVGIALLGSDYSFLRLSARASHWSTLKIGTHGHVVRLDAFAGALFGEAPLFLRFYVGDLSDFLPSRVLDLNFDRRPPPNFLRTSVVEMRYEDFATRLSAEYRIPVHRGFRSVYGVDLFASAGVFALLSRRDVTYPARGYDGLARVPIDLTFNLGVRVSTKAGGFVLAVANVVGFFPIRSEVGP